MKANGNKSAGTANTDAPWKEGQLKLIRNSTEHDRGIIEYPMLSPHFEIQELSGTDTPNSLLLVSATFTTVMTGQRYLDILPLLDGTRTRHEIAKSVAGSHTRMEVQTALVALATKGYILSGEFSMDRDFAAFWSSWGISPRFAEERLSAARIEVVGDGGRFTSDLADMGLAVCTENPTLTVIITNDYLSSDHAETNRKNLESGNPWILVKFNGLNPCFGPVFASTEEEGEPKACWACVEHRMSANREVEKYIRHLDRKRSDIPGHGNVPVFSSAVRGLAAMEIAKWVVDPKFSTISGHLMSCEPFSLDCSRHIAGRRPQCTTCGDPELYRTDRVSAPIEIRSSPKPIVNSGGLRSVPPSETLRQYRHLIDPITGVVTQLLRSTEESDPWLHVYYAGSNLALQSGSLRLLQNSLRSKSSGKGSTVEQAEASALCEAIERYSGVFHGDEIRHRARFSDFADGDAIHPQEIQHYSDWQFDHAVEINARNYRFCYIPYRFDPDLEMDWTPVWSVTAGRHRYLPTAMLYFSMPLDKPGMVYCPPDSNGCASGNTLEEAILQGFFELVERDAFACWWYNRIQFPELDLDSFGDPYLSGAREYYASVNRDIWVIDITNDLGIPVFVAVSRRTDKEAEDIAFSAGAHFNPHIAALRAVCELNQYLSAIRDSKPDGSGYLYDDPEANWWWKSAKLADHSYLSPAPGVPMRKKSDYNEPESKDIKDDVERCRAIVEGKGMEFLVLDQTRPDIGMPVARTIVPGLRHFWARFAPGRLFDVPVEMGLLEKPIPEAELNPVAVFI